MSAVALPINKYFNGKDKCMITCDRSAVILLCQIVDRLQDSNLNYNIQRQSQANPPQQFVTTLSGFGEEINACFM